MKVMKLKALRNLSVVFVFVLCLPLLANADRFSCASSISDVKGLVSKIESSYSAVTGLHTRFVEQSYLVGLDRRTVSKGIVWFQKPGKMNWLYEEPERQQFVSDGQTAWFYQPNLQQVTLTDFQESFQSSLPISFLLGLGKISESFKIKNACKNKEGFVLRMSPAASDNNIEELYLYVRAEDYIPLSAKIFDLSSNETTITFFEPQLNQKPKEGQFTFDIPKGVDIIDQRQGVAMQGMPIIIEKEMLKKEE